MIEKLGQKNVCFHYKRKRLAQLGGRCSSRVVSDAAIERRKKQKTKSRSRSDVALGEKKP